MRKLMLLCAVGHGRTNVARNGERPPPQNQRRLTKTDRKIILPASPPKAGSKKRNHPNCVVVLLLIILLCKNSKTPVSTPRQRSHVHTMTKSAKNNKKASAVKAGSTVKKAKTTTKTELLEIIAQLASLHKGAAPLDLVARRAAYGNATNPSFKKAIQRAGKQGLLMVENNTVQLTDLGIFQAGDAPDWVQSNSQAQAKMKEVLTPKMRIVFDMILEDGGQPKSCTMLATRLEYPNTKDKGFKKLLTACARRGALILWIRVRPCSFRIWPIRPVATKRKWVWNESTGWCATRVGSTYFLKNRTFVTSFIVILISSKHTHL